MKARDHHTDPVFVSHIGPEFVSEWMAADPQRKMIELRIGEASGDSRHTVLTPREAQRIAIALLTFAEAAVPTLGQTINTYYGSTINGSAPFSS
jgi:hypothetical protein